MYMVSVHAAGGCATQEIVHAGGTNALQQGGVCLARGLSKSVTTNAPNTN